MEQPPEFPTADKVPTFDELWAAHGGYWSVDWGNGESVSGIYRPERPKPKLRLIRGGRYGELGNG